MEDVVGRWIPFLVYSHIHYLLTQAKIVLQTFTLYADAQEEHMKGVENIIKEASLFENPEEIRKQQHFRDECRKAAIRTSEHDF